jgi:hypothetical protein
MVFWGQFDSKRHFCILRYGFYFRLFKTSRSSYTPVPQNPGTSKDIESSGSLTNDPNEVRVSLMNNEDSDEDEASRDNVTLV